MKRQRSRNRNPGGGGGGGGNKPQQHNANRAFDSNGPEGVKVRGAAQGVYEKYQQLARDAQTAGDRVLAENYLQHAEHYFRLLRAMQPLRPLSEIIGRDQFVSGYDIDFEDESLLEAAEAAEALQLQQQQEQPEAAEGERRQEPRQDNRQGDYRQNDNRQNDNRQNDFRRDDRPRDDRYQGDRNQNDRYPNDRYQGDRPQQDRPQGERYQGGQAQQGERPRNDRNRDDRGQRPYRDDRPRYDRDDRGRDERGRDETSRDDRQPPAELVAAQPAYAPAMGADPEVRNVEPTRVLRADDGEVSAAPAFLQARPATEGEEVRRPRRRRAPASFEPVSEAPPAASTED